MSNEKMLVQMESFLDIGKEKRPSLETHIVSNSHNLRDGVKSFTGNTASLSCTLGNVR